MSDAFISSLEARFPRLAKEIQASAKAIYDADSIVSKCNAGDMSFLRSKDAILTLAQMKALPSPIAKYLVGKLIDPPPTAQELVNLAAEKFQAGMSESDVRKWLEETLHDIKATPEFKKIVDRVIHDSREQVPRLVVMDPTKRGKELLGRVSNAIARGNYTGAADYLGAAEAAGAPQDAVERYRQQIARAIEMNVKAGKAKLGETAVLTGMGYGIPTQVRPLQARPTPVYTIPSTSSVSAFEWVQSQFPGLEPEAQKSIESYIEAALDSDDDRGFDREIDNLRNYLTKYYGKSDIANAVASKARGFFHSQFEHRAAARKQENADEVDRLIHEVEAVA